MGTLNLPDLKMAEADKKEQRVKETGQENDEPITGLVNAGPGQ